MPHKPLYRAVAAVLIACFSLVAGCSGKSADDSLGAAKAHLAKNELPAAVIELKNALQAQPDLAEARFLLGKALLGREEYVTAAVELRKASDLNYPADQVGPLLATALLRSGETRKVVELDKATLLTDPEAISSLKTTLALAHEAQGEPAKADDAVAAALKAKPDHAPALLHRARSLARKGEFDAAAKIVDDVIVRTPADAAALVLKGQLLQFNRNDPKGATEQYRKAIAAEPGDVAARAALLTQLLGENNLEGALAQFEALKKLRPVDPQTLYFQAQVQAQGGDLKAAHETIQQLLKYPDPNAQTLHLAGVVALRRNELLLAEQHFSRVVQLVPTAPGPRHALAQVLLRMGEPHKALATLEPLLAATAPDGQTLFLAGSAHLAANELKQAEELYRRAAKANPGDAMGRTALAVTRFRSGNTAEAMSELEAISKSDTGTAADLALITANLIGRNFDAALKAIDQLEKKQPGTPQAPHIRASLLSSRGDVAGARANYAKALTADANYFPSIEGLAALDLRERKPEQARARFDALLKADPNDVRAITALAVLDDRAGKSRQEVAAALGRAIAIKPSDAALRRRLIEFHMGKQDRKLALAAAQDAVAALPKDVQLLALLADAQLANGDTNQALSSYNKLVAERPNLPQPLLALAEAQLSVKAYAAATDAVNRALALAPESLAVIRVAVKVDAQAGRHEQALAKTRKLQAQSPKEPHGWLLEGEVEQLRSNWPAAAVAFRAALSKQDTTPIAQRLHLALRNAGDKAKTEAFAAEWLKKHPQDPAFLFYLAGLSIADKQFELAATQLEMVLRSSPDHPMALNNLAWVQATLKQPGALANAERVNELNPNQPAFMDTLAFALAADGKIARAVELQKKVVAMAPEAHGLRLQMARLYLQAGDKAAARTELDTLAKLGDQFPQQNEVRELQGKL